MPTWACLTCLLCNVLLLLNTLSQYILNDLSEKPAGPQVNPYLCLRVRVSSGTGMGSSPESRYPWQSLRMRPKILLETTKKGSQLQVTMVKKVGTIDHLGQWTGSLICNNDTIMISVRGPPGPSFLVVCSSSYSYFSYICISPYDTHTPPYRCSRPGFHM